MFPQGVQALLLRLVGPRNKSGVTLDIVERTSNSVTNSPPPTGLIFFGERKRKRGSAKGPRPVSRLFRRPPPRPRSRRRDGGRPSDRRQGRVRHRLRPIPPIRTSRCPT